MSTLERHVYGEAQAAARGCMRRGCTFPARRRVRITERGIPHTFDVCGGACDAELAVGGEAVDGRASWCGADDCHGGLTGDGPCRRCAGDLLPAVCVDDCDDDGL